MKPQPFYATEHGKAYLADALDFMPTMADSTVSLIFTSPPYALHFKKEYGNVNQGDYIAWFLKFARHYHRLLRDDGSFVLDIGGAWKPGQPTRSLYHFELLIALCKEVGFHLAQEFFWYNPGKLPSPAEWVNVRKIRVKDAVECVWWLSKTPWPKANNQQVLNEYSPDMKRLLEKGYRPKVRPSGHIITKKFKDRGGSIPSNIFICGNNDANGHYLERCKAEGIKPHPARFPHQLPSFFVRFLTDPGDLILDPFAGSNTTGQACEQEGRKWIAIEKEREYLEGSRFRFEEDAPAQLVTGPIELPLNGLAGKQRSAGKKRDDQPELFD